MTVREILSLGEKRLIESGIEDAARDSKSLYCYLIGIPVGKLFMEYQYRLQDLLCEQYFDLVDRRAAGEPLQYIVGSQEFMGIEFRVDPRVLIPRMDTETLVENALSIIRDGRLVDEGARVVGERGAWNVLDLCTGSGAIGISIAKLAEVAVHTGDSQLSRRDEKLNEEKTKQLAKSIKVTLTDISEGALDVARENARLNGVEGNVKAVCGDLFSPFKKLFKKQKFDMIVSNPPYIESKAIDSLQREIRDHEPMVALDGGADGLDFYRRIASEAPDYLEDGGVILLEIGDTQGQAVKALLGDAGFTHTRVICDLAGRDRVVFGLYAKEK